MIPRTLVPVDARPPATNGVEPTTRRRPTSMDERTLVPAMLPIIVLDGRSSIPTNLPLDSISKRVVVPRDINREAYNVVEDHTIPAQPSDLDERVTVPLGSQLPEVVPPAEFTPPDIVEPDLFTTGEVHLVAQAPSVPRYRWDILVGAVAFHVLLILALIFGPRHVPSPDDQEIARKSLTMILPPGAFELNQPHAPAPPASHVRVDPREIAKVAPTPKVELPKTVEPPRELPSAPVPKASSEPAAPDPQAQKIDSPKPTLKLETPDTPIPHPQLTLPQNSSPGHAIDNILHGGGERPNGPRPIVQGGPIRGGGLGQRGGGGTAYGGLEMLTPDEGVDFSGYLQRVYYTVKRNWFAVMPSSVELGEKGIVQLTFRINRDGSVSSNDPQIQYRSGKEPLDRAAYSSIRASNPFETLPPQFSGPYIELRYTYYYNIIPGSEGAP
jgi:outer membrane biosynthesis protein TonB